MRTLVALLSGVGLLAAAGPSLSVGPPAVSVSVSTFKVLAGHPVVLAGRISTGEAGRRVAIYSQPVGASHWRRVHAVTTRAGGHWVVAATPAIATAYQARWGPVRSRILGVGVRPLAVARELPGGRVWARIKAARSFNGRIVQLQQQAGSGWKTVSRQRLGSRSTTVFSLPLPTSAIRVAMSVNQAGKGYLGTMSHTLLYTGHELSLAVSTYRVVYGRSLVLAGRLSSGRAGARITVRAWPYGTSAPHTIAHVTTRAGGRWSFRAAPRIQTTYTAHWGVVSSPYLTVGVQPAMSIRELANGNVWTRVRAAKSMRGRAVQLQQRTAGGIWKTVAKKPLDGHSTAVFAGSLASSAIRTAMSVNQAGAGYLGGTSRVIAYRPT
jgi:hypothetical protein